MTITRVSDGHHTCSIRLERRTIQAVRPAYLYASSLDSCGSEEALVLPTGIMKNTEISSSDSR